MNPSQYRAGRSFSKTIAATVLWSSTGDHRPGDAACQPAAHAGQVPGVQRAEAPEEPAAGPAQASHRRRELLHQHHHPPHRSGGLKVC